MPTIRSDARSALNKTLYTTSENTAIAWLANIMAAAVGTTNAEDALTVLNRKLEATGILASGTGAPVFANQTAIFYIDTDADRLYVRETSAYTPLAIGATETDIIGHAAADPTSSPTAVSPWIYVRTDRNQIWLKERLGSAGSYTYAWAGPIFEGQHRTEIVYNTADDPGNLSISWDWKTDTFSPSGGGWTGNSTGAKWAIIVSLPRNSNTAVASARFPLQTAGFEANEIVGIGRTTPAFNNAHSATAPLLFYNTATAEFWMKTASEYRQITGTAGDIGYDRRNTDTVLGSAIDTVEDAINELADQVAILLARPSGGGTGTDDQNAAEVPTTTTDFGQNIPTSASNVQLALDAIDNLDVPPYYRLVREHQSNLLTAVGNFYEYEITLPQKLRDYRDNTGEPLFIKIDANVELEASGDPSSAFVVVVELLDSTRNAVTPPITSAAERLDGNGARVIRDIDINGILPSTFNSGYLRTRVTRTEGVSGGGVRYYNVEIYPDASAVDSSRFDGNLAVTDNTLQKVAQKFDDYAPPGTTPQNASQVPLILTPTPPFRDPGAFPGGLRNIGESGFENNPDDVRAALRVTDERLINAFDPYKVSQGLNIFNVGSGTFTSTFTVNAATPIYSDPVDITRAIRALGTDITVRVSVRLQTLGADFVGDVRLVDSDNRALFFGDAEIVNNTIYDTGDFVTFQRTIAAASVPDTFEVRFRRTAGTSTSIFDEGHAYVINITGGATGGVGGQASIYSSAIIWKAGALLTERRTTVSEVDNITLLEGHRFSAYDQLAFVFDGGAGATQPLIPCWIDANLFQAFGATGTLWIVGSWWLMVSRQSPTTFRWRWRGANNGLRRIMGIRTN